MPILSSSQKDRIAEPFIIIREAYQLKFMDYPPSEKYFWNGNYFDLDIRHAKIYPEFSYAIEDSLKIGHDVQVKNAGCNTICGQCPFIIGCT